MQASGRLLNHVADSAGIHDEGARTCCGALTCFGLCYLTDLFCAIPTMTETEEKLDKYSLPIFAFYECCWPCMKVLNCCLGKEKARNIREDVWPLDYFNPYVHYAVIATERAQPTPESSHGMV